MTRAPGSHLLAAILLLALAGGCSRGESAGDSEPAGRPSPTPIGQPTPEPVDELPPEEANGPPELHLVGDDYEQVVRSYMAFRTWLLRHPDPELFDEITHPDCDCYIQKNLLASHAEQGLRWTSEGPGILVREVEVIDDLAPNLVHLQVVFERPAPGELVDAEGTVHDRVDPRRPWLEDLIFVREDAQSPWRLRDFTHRGPVEEAPDG